MFWGFALSLLLEILDNEGKTLDTVLTMSCDVLFCSR